MDNYHSVITLTYTHMRIDEESGNDACNRGEMLMCVADIDYLCEIHHKSTCAAPSCGAE